VRGSGRWVLGDLKLRGDWDLQERIEGAVSNVSGCIDLDETTVLLQEPFQVAAEQ